jgi:hypothetical protein
MATNGVSGARAAMLVAPLLGGLAGAPQPQPGREAPLVLDFQQGIRAELVDLSFVETVADGTRTMTVAGDKKGRYRLGIATVKISKPAGTRLTLACADLTLHYYHGEEAEVVPCEGMSLFTSRIDSEREVLLGNSDGPGFLKKSTAPRTTETDTVYVDVLFASMEPDTREAWIAVAQVADRTRPFVSRGWIVPGGSE